jgi:protein SCO1/2
MNFRRRLMLSAMAGVLCLLGGGLTTIWAIRRPAAETAGDATLPPIGGPFSLTRADGVRVTDATYYGRILLVYFGYTFCPDACPTTLGVIAEALDRLGPKADAVQPLFISVDPARDTPVVLASYVANFSPRIAGLTGTPEQIAAVAKEYGVYYARHDISDVPGGYVLDHSSIVYVMDRQGRFVESFDPETTPDEMTRALTTLIAHSS